MNELNKRNTETVEIVMKQQNMKIEEQQIRIDQLSNAVTNLTQQVADLKIMVVMQKAKSMGSGPSVT